MITPYYFIKDILKNGFKINLESLNVNLVNFILIYYQSIQLLVLKQHKLIKS